MILLFSGVTQEMITVGRAQGKILQPRNYSDFIAQRSGVKRKQCAEASRAIREVKAAKVLRDLTSEEGVVKHDGDDVLIVPLSPDAQTRLDQKFVRRVVIGDLKFGTLQQGTGFDEFIKQDLLPAVKAVHSWVPFFTPEGEQHEGFRFSCHSTANVQPDEDV